MADTPLPERAAPFASPHGAARGAVLRARHRIFGEAGGRRGLRVRLADAVARDGVPGVDYVDMPTFVIPPWNSRPGRSK